MLKKQSDFLSNTADSSFCRIDVSFRWVKNTAGILLSKYPQYLFLMFFYKPMIIWSIYFLNFLQA